MLVYGLKRATSGLQRDQISFIQAIWDGNVPVGEFMMLSQIGPLLDVYEPPELLFVNLPSIRKFFYNLPVITFINCS